MRQAVVLIHGIGEQKPMGTVRSFVKAILGPGTDDQPTYWSKPDKMSQSFELRRLSSRGRSPTDFYEYYWASNVEGTKLWDLGRWVLALIKRPWRDVPTGTRSLWLVSRALTVPAIVILALGWAEAWYQQIAELGALSLLVSGVLLIVQFVLVNYLGDAARYLSPLPGNIKLRQTIRKEGVELLRTLHESGKYDRIVVVGHSLGSVIAYDAITHLWQEFNEGLPGLSKPAVQAEVRRRMEQGHGVQPAVRDEISMLGDAMTADGAGLDQFRAGQVDAWREQRYFGNAWLISDFITLGSPLAHAQLLMADNKSDFAARKRERELPTCPPQRDEKGYSYGGTTLDVGEGKKFTPLVLHHAAPFAVTRWTNLYFPAALGLFGDIVGGPLREYFGRGIKDIPVTTSLWHGLARHTLVAHTSYWFAGDGEQSAQDAPRPPALFKLKQELALPRLREFAPRLKEPKKEAALMQPASMSVAVPLAPRGEPADRG